mmetsp:Transcript_39889/g.110886  ORF Transcript_39889/g.110886 Transcript_39889/m.110886 type:complete len:306 (-) Transcript_39889:228-1145(-)
MRDGPAKRLLPTRAGSLCHPKLPEQPGAISRSMVLDVIPCQAAIDHNGSACDVRRLIRRKVHSAERDVLRLAKAGQGNLAEQFLQLRGVLEHGTVDWSLDSTRRNVVDSDAACRELNREVAGHHFHCSFGSTVGGETRERQVFVHRRNVHHGAPDAFVLALPGEGLRAEERTLHVHIHDPVVIPLRDIKEVALDLHARVVHQDVHLAPLAPGRLDERLAGLLLAHVAVDLERAPLAPDGLALPHGVVGACRVGAVVHDDARALPREHDGDALADALGATGDDGNLARQAPSNRPGERQRVTRRHG